MTLIVETLPATGGTSFAADAIRDALVLNNYELVLDQTKGTGVANSYRVFKNPAAQNGCGHDWFLAVMEQSDTYIGFLVSENLDADLFKMTENVAYGQYGIAMQPQKNYSINSSYLLNTNASVPSQVYAFIPTRYVASGTLAFAVTPQSFMVAAAPSQGFAIYVGRFEPMNNHPSEDGMAVVQATQWLFLRGVGANNTKNNNPIVALGPNQGADRLLGNRPRAARILLQEPDAARGLLKDVLLIPSQGGQYGDIATVEVDGVLTDYTNVGGFIRTAVL